MHFALPDRDLSRACQPLGPGYCRHTGRTDTTARSRVDIWGKIGYYRIEKGKSKIEVSLRISKPQSILTRLEQSKLPLSQEPIPYFSKIGSRLFLPLSSVISLPTVDGFCRGLITPVWVGVNPNFYISSSTQSFHSTSIRTLYIYIHAGSWGLCIITLTIWHLPIVKQC